MEEKNIDKKREDGEISAQRLFAAVWHKAWLVSLVAVLCAVLTFLGTLYFVTPTYESAAMFYVNNNSLSVGDATFSLSSGDITAAKDLVNSYIVILKTRTTLLDVIDYAGVDMDYTELREMISAQSVNNTEIFEVVVTSEDPYEAEKLANAIAYILPKRIDSTIEGTSARIVDAAIVASNPSAPNYTINTIIGFLAGFMISVVAIVLRELFDITIRTEEDMEMVCSHPVLTVVPDMAAPSKGSYYYYGYGSKRRGNAKKIITNHQKEQDLFGEGISFAAAEAYKLLRTKLQFSFADDSDSRVIGFSSALSGEGKSLTAVNLAYTIAQLDKKVVLIDCDMRRPTLADKLKLRKQPGLSGYLTGQHLLDEMIQKCGLKGAEEAFDVIAAGQNPPNPIELLSSDRMTKFLKQLRDRYDYIILDLPPVGEVSDAMAVAKETDGMLLVVRQNYCDRLALKDAVRQFAFIETKILGVVYNCATESSGRYGKKYYKRYYRNKNSYGKYEGAYLTAEKRAANRRRAEERRNMDK